MLNNVSVDVDFLDGFGKMKVVIFYTNIQICKSEDRTNEQGNV